MLHFLTHEFVWAFLGISGGVIRELNNWLFRGCKIDWLRIVVHGLVSGFCGYVTGASVHYFYEALSNPASAVGGWFGCNIFKWMARLVGDRLGTKLDDS